MDSLGLDTVGLRHADTASSTFAIIAEATVALVLLAAWIAFFSYLIRFIIRRKRSKRGSLPITNVYGAWQGHNLGTTTLEPGELTTIERNLRDESLNSE